MSSLVATTKCRDQIDALEREIGGATRRAGALFYAIDGLIDHSQSYGDTELLDRHEEHLRTLGEIGGDIIREYDRRIGDQLREFTDMLRAEERADQESGTPPSPDSHATVTTPDATDIPTRQSAVALPPKAKRKAVG